MPRTECFFCPSSEYQSPPGNGTGVVGGSRLTLDATNVPGKNLPAGNAGAVAAAVAVLPSCATLNRVTTLVSWLETKQCPSLSKVRSKGCTIAGQLLRETNSPTSS